LAGNKSDLVKPVVSQVEKDSNESLPSNVDLKQSHNIQNKKFTRQVKFLQLAQFGNANNLIYYETSAKDGENVNFLCERICKLMMEKCTNINLEENSIENNNLEEQSKKCC